MVNLAHLRLLCVGLLVMNVSLGIAHWKLLNREVTTIQVSGRNGEVLRLGELAAKPNGPENTRFGWQVFGSNGELRMQASIVGDSSISFRMIQVNGASFNVAVGNISTLMGLSGPGPGAHYVVESSEDGLPTVMVMGKDSKKWQPIPLLPK